MHMRIIPPFVLILLLIPLDTHSQTQFPLPDGLLQTSLKAARESGLHGLARALAPTLEDDAVLVYPGAPLIHSRESILAFLKKQPNSRTRIQWDAVAAEQSAESTLVVMYGTTTRLPRSSGLAADAGRFIAAWHKSDEGTWKLAAFCLSVVPAPGEVVLRDMEQWSNHPLQPLTRTNPFARADYEFSDRSSAANAATAFGEFAAPDAAVTGGKAIPYTCGPHNIRLAMERSGANSYRWQWWPVFALGDSTGGLGATVGEAEISAPVAQGPVEVLYTVYMTLWRRMSDGTIRFIADAGGPRPEPKGRY